MKISMRDLFDENINDWLVWWKKSMIFFYWIIIWILFYLFSLIFISICICSYMFTYHVVSLQHSYLFSMIFLLFTGGHSKLHLTHSDLWPHICCDVRCRYTMTSPWMPQSRLTISPNFKFRLYLFFHVVDRCYHFMSHFVCSSKL